MDVVPESLTEAVQRRLAELNIHIDGLAGLNRGQPTPMIVAIGGRLIDAIVLYLPHMSATEALQATHAAPPETPLLVIGPRVHESTAKTLRARGIWYLDQSGNAFLRGQGLLIDVRGRRDDRSSPPDDGGHAAPTNPFSPKRAQVVFVLLSRPELVNAPLRELARHAGVSLGIAKEVIDTLATIGFVERAGNDRELVRGDELLDLWASTYSANLGRANQIFAGSGDVSNWSVPDGTEFAVSGEQAVPAKIRHAETLVLYIRADKKTGTPTELLLRNRWRRDPAGNITIRRLFWRDLDAVGDDLAPPLLIYADLLAAHEPRQTQVAHELRQDLEQRI